jgi:hypothetical protein
MLASVRSALAQRRSAPDLSVPSFSLSDRDGAASMLAALVTSGCVIVRNALDPVRLRMYRDEVVDWFDRLDARAASDERNHFLDIYRIQSGMALTPNADHDSRPPPGARDIVPMLARSALFKVCQHIYQQQPLALMIDGSSVRRQQPGQFGKALGYHQDGPVVGLHDKNHTGLVFWIPLTKIDQDTAGLELATNEPVQYHVHEDNPQNHYMRIADPSYDETVIVSGLDIGDVGVFWLHTPHRTHLIPGMTKTRFSVDLRAVPITSLPVTSKGWSYIA